MSAAGGMRGSGSGDGPGTAWLFGLQRFGLRPGQQRVRALLDALGRPDDRFDAVLVAGTNGKGAVTAALAAMLDAAGRPSGRFTSPHLTRPGERIVVAGRELADADFERLAARVRPAAEGAGATFFEVVTAMACLAFAESGVEIAVLEAGMGGRHDATNVLDPVASIVTNVALDHADVLGDTVEAIARDKAGVLRPGRPSWTAAEGAALEALAEEAASTGARLRRLAAASAETTADLSRPPADALYDAVPRGWDGVEVEVRTLPDRSADAAGAERAGGVPPLRLRSPLLGRHQGANLAVAALTARELGVADEAIGAAARSFVWPGRLERVDASPAGFDGVRLLLDGAHNPAAGTVLAAALADLEVRPHLVFGASREKDATGILAALAPEVASVRLTRARTSPRAATPGRLQEVARSVGAPVAAAYERPTEAVAAAAAEAARDGSAVLVAGSLYLVGEVRPWLRGEPVPRLERLQ